jgi:hypothetical protein
MQALTAALRGLLARARSSGEQGGDAGASCDAAAHPAASPPENGFDALSALPEDVKARAPLRLRCVAALQAR